MAEAAEILALLRQRGMTLATAESCTGGMLGSLFTEVPGSSAVYHGGVISYCNDLKHRLLGVPQALLDRFGAVSAEVAESMAAGARVVGAASVGIGITGLAGPESDESGLPVGLVYIGYSDRDHTCHRRIHAAGDRQAVRIAACDAALELLLEKLT